MSPFLEQLSERGGVSSGDRALQILPLLTASQTKTMEDLEEEERARDALVGSPGTGSPAINSSKGDSDISRRLASQESEMRMIKSKLAA